jgi:hypothetical protein
MLAFRAEVSKFYTHLSVEYLTLTLVYHIVSYHISALHLCNPVKQHVLIYTHLDLILPIKHPSTSRLKVMLLDEI